jgi:hypothetical protein
MNLQIFKKINFHKGYHKRTSRAFLLSGWKAIVYASIIGVAVVFVGSLYIYRRINNGNFIIGDINSNITVKPVDKKSLSQVILYFEQKKLKAESVMERKFIDPSL